MKREIDAIICWAGTTKVNGGLTDFAGTISRQANSHSCDSSAISAKVNGRSKALEQRLKFFLRLNSEIVFIVTGCIKSN
jgi:hypothetical protein